MNKHTYEWMHIRGRLGWRLVGLAAKVMPKDYYRLDFERWLEYGVRYTPGNYRGGWIDENRLH